MAITLSDDHEIFRDGERIMFPRDGNHSPSAFLSGFDTNEDIVFGSFTPEGKLRVDASVSIDSVDIGDVNTMLKVGGVNRYWNGVLNPDTLTYAGYVQDQRMTFNGGNLNIAVVPVETDGGIVVWDELLAQGAGSDYIVSYTVPVGAAFYLTRAQASGTNKGEYWVQINEGPIIGKKRTYYSEYNADMEFESYKLVAGDVVFLFMRHTQTSVGDFDGNIQGQLVWLP